MLLRKRRVAVAPSEPRDFPLRPGNERVSSAIPERQLAPHVSHGTQSRSLRPHEKQVSHPGAQGCPLGDQDPQGRPLRKYGTQGGSLAAQCLQGNTCNPRQTVDTLCCAAHAPASHAPPLIPGASPWCRGTQGFPLNSQGTKGGRLRSQGRQGYILHPRSTLGLPLRAQEIHGGALSHGSQGRHLRAKGMRGRLLSPQRN